MWRGRTVRACDNNQGRRRDGGLLLSPQAEDGEAKKASNKGGYFRSEKGKRKNRGDDTSSFHRGSSSSPSLPESLAGKASEFEGVP
mmetsp:Transcript_16543/g.33681  ORF Transcript_16543/g.33681 Transcript_16543/m.33681 type:complete len:86 (+) Transcript_16543:140-397(+)